MERITLDELINETHGWEWVEWLDNSVNRIISEYNTGNN